MELKCESIAIPLIASGGNRFPKTEALQIALEVINRFLMENELEVTLVVFDKKSFELSGRVFQAVQAYVDQHYVDDHRRQEYPHKDEAALAAMDEGTQFQDISDNMVSSATFPGGLHQPQRIAGILGRLTKEKLMQRKEESFQECLLRLMRERELDPPDVYKPANLDRRMFSKILSDKDAKPKKRTVIAIALHSVVKDYDKIGKRNHKKDDNHLNKHAMHLVRLFMMGIDILEKEEIRTHRPEEDLKLLRSIRNGDYMEDSVLTPDFYEIVSDYEKRFTEAERKSKLPDSPDMNRIGRFVEMINREAIREDL